MGNEFLVKVSGAHSAQSWSSKDPELVALLQSLPLLLTLVQLQSIDPKIHSILDPPWLNVLSPSAFHHRCGTLPGISPPNFDHRLHCQAAAHVGTPRMRCPIPQTLEFGGCGFRALDHAFWFQSIGLYVWKTKVIYRDISIYLDIWMLIYLCDNLSSLFGSPNFLNPDLEGRRSTTSKLSFLPLPMFSKRARMISLVARTPRCWT